MRRAALLLLPIGPFCIAALRYLLPYYTADNNVAIVQAVNEHPGRESAVLWLGLVGVLTLVPGLIAAAAILPPSRLKAWAMGLAVPGYLCLGVLLAQDSLLWSGANSGADPKQVTLLGGNADAGGLLPTAPHAPRGGRGLLPARRADRSPGR